MHQLLMLQLHKKICKVNSKNYHFILSDACLSIITLAELLSNHLYLSNITLVFLTSMGWKFHGCYSKSESYKEY